MGVKRPDLVSTLLLNVCVGDVCVGESEGY